MGALAGELGAPGAVLMLRQGAGDGVGAGLPP